MGVNYMKIKILLHLPSINFFTKSSGAWYNNKNEVIAVALALHTNSVLSPGSLKKPSISLPSALLAGFGLFVVSSTLLGSSVGIVVATALLSVGVIAYSAKFHHRPKFVASQPIIGPTKNLESPSLSLTSSNATCVSGYQPQNIIDWEHASLAIREQIQVAWPELAEKCKKDESCACAQKQLFFVQEGQLLGFVTLTENKPPLNRIVAQKLENRTLCYIDRIEIIPHGKGKGYGRKLFEWICHSLIEKGFCVSLTDATGLYHEGDNLPSSKRSIGDELYGGEKTRRQFDVSVQLTSPNGNYYLIEKKSGETKPLKYLPIDFKNMRIPYLFGNIRGLVHLVDYLKQHLQDQEQLRKCHARLLSLPDSDVRISLSGADLEIYDSLLSQIRKNF
jgi:GNAT superfamily N-acetyltransferase